MSADEAHRRRKSVRRRKVDSSTPHTIQPTDHRKHEPPAPQQPDILEQPKTLDDIREARLKYLLTPREERFKKMRYEHERSVKVKGVANATAAKDGSTVSRARSDTKNPSRSSRKKPRKVEADHEEEESQYVYGPPHERQHVPGAFDPQHNEPGEHTERERTVPKSRKVSRTKTERRNTEPVVRHTSSSKDAKSHASSRPTLRKSTTTIPERPRVMQRRSSVAAKPETEAATVVSSASAPKRSGSVFGNLFGTRTQTAERKVPCLTCGDDVPVSRSAKLPCTHRMCHPCLKRIFKLSVTDPAHMPPRCCTDQPISLKHVETLFDQEFKKNYNRRFKEYSTKNKIYCPARGCGEWIQPKHISMDKGRKIGRCPSCKTFVCAICSQKMHRTRDCPKDPATKEFVETAKQAGWKKCYNCSAMVELKEGCNHMTCRCTAEFCMMCGLKWKSCDCPWFNYDQVDVNGDPIRYQQEMDRRREQEQRDAAMARRLETFQLDDDRPAQRDWFWFGDVPRNPNQNFVNNAREALAADLNRDNHDTQGFHHNLFAGHDDTPIMPGGWNDGPQQFEQMPQDPQSRPRRHQRNAIDRADMDEELRRIGNRNGVPMWQHRVHRRRDTAPPAATTGVFEGRNLTADEEDQRRRIRAWATGASNN